MARPNAQTMRTLVNKGQAMPPEPGSDRPGRFNIRNRADLDKAINAADMIPPTWQADGTLKAS